MIVLTGATGQIGSRIVAQLAPGPEPVRVVVRDPARLPDGIADRVEVVVGSHGDPAVIDAALAGADTLFWLLSADVTAPSAHDAYVGFSRPAVDALRRHGVQRVVDITATGRGTAYERAAGFVSASLEMDDLIASSGVDFRALACPTLMDNVLRQVSSIRDDGTYTGLLTPERPQRLVAIADVADIATRLLADGSWSGQQEVPLLGPADLTMLELVTTMSDVVGRPVRYLQETAGDFTTRMTGFGVSSGMADGLVEMAVAKDHGLDFGVTRTPQHAIDTPTTFGQWCTNTLLPALASTA